ncbi:MAG: hypothetical protein SangKO_086830 [Sandaracinaceae bacterium]
MAGVADPDTRDGCGMSTYVDSHAYPLSYAGELVISWIRSLPAGVESAVMDGLAGEGEPVFDFREDIARPGKLESRVRGILEGAPGPGAVVVICALIDLVFCGRDTREVMERGRARLERSIEFSESRGDQDAARLRRAVLEPRELYERQWLAAVHRWRELRRGELSLEAIAAPHRVPGPELADLLPPEPSEDG